MNTHSFRIFYCQEWLWGEDQGACSPLTQEEAKKLHDKKMLYAVIIGSFIEKPTYVITLNESNDFFSVNFFDNWGRDYLNSPVSEISRFRKILPFYGSLAGIYEFGFS